MTQYVNNLFWTLLDLKTLKSPGLRGFIGLPWMLLEDEMVEAAGVEPASASTLPSALHVYSIY